jgi:hypothetical protein
MRIQKSNPRTEGHVVLVGSYIIGETLILGFSKRSLIQQDGMLKGTNSMAIVALVVLMLLSGCVTTPYSALYVSENKVVKDTEYSQDLRNHLDSLKKGPTVEGSDCYFVGPFMWWDKQTPSENAAVREALQTAGKPYDALTHVHVERSMYFYVVGYTVCNKINGTATINEPYSTKQNTEKS